jgi:hypothetical protein
VPTWGELLQEHNAFAKRHPGVAPFDPIRRKYLSLLSDYTGRSTILYATRWLQGSVSDSALVSIVAEDVEAFMEVVHGLDVARGLDLILHSPGGSPEAAEAIVHYLRKRFAQIRVIVPHMAMSAATLLSCAANEIVLGAHSSLGPIDPQLIMPSPGGGSMSAPAQSILDQFKRALDECQDPKNLGAWMPMLPQYGPALLKQCENALALAEELASEWLRTWMFAGNPTGADLAKKIAQSLADHSAFKSHGRPIHRDAAAKMGLIVTALEDDQKLQDLVLTVYHATTQVFTANPSAVKIVENQLGRAFIKSQQIVQVQVQPTPARAPQSALLST